MKRLALAAALFAAFIAAAARGTNFEPAYALRLLTHPVPLRCQEQWVEQSPPLTRTCVSVYLTVKKEQSK